jgi:hypothetical protein
MDIPLLSYECEVLSKVVKTKPINGVVLFCAGKRPYVQAECRGLNALREACADYLALYGFDDDYKPNHEGRVLEALIDKLHV